MLAASVPNSVACRCAVAAVPREAAAAELLCKLALHEGALLRFSGGQKYRCASRKQEFNRPGLPLRGFPIAMRVHSHWSAHGSTRQVAVSRTAAARDSRTRPAGTSGRPARDTCQGQTGTTCCHGRPVSCVASEIQHIITLLRELADMADRN